MDERQIDDAIDMMDRAIAARIATIQAQVEQRSDTIECIDCDEEIPASRRELVPNARRCVGCQIRLERR